MSDPSTLRCMTIRQPWAHLIATGVKPVENRVRRTNHRGAVGIHAGLRDDPYGWINPLVEKGLGGLYPTEDLRRKCPHGAIIAVADLTDCHLAEGCCGPWAEPHILWHLTLENVRPLPTPVKARGGLALPWTAPPDVARMVWEQIGVPA